MKQKWINLQTYKIDTSNVGGGYLFISINYNYISCIEYKI